VVVPYVEVISAKSSGVRTLRSKRVLNQQDCKSNLHSVSAFGRKNPKKVFMHSSKVVFKTVRSKLKSKLFHNFS
jgi:hypothetical protein